MLQTLRNAWSIPELRKKIIFTLFILLIYRVGNVIPVPFIDVATLANYFDSVLSTTIFGLMNAMSGSAFSQATVFALGIQPYINSSIIIQLLTIAIPALENYKIEFLVKAPGGMLVYALLIALVAAITHGKAPAKSDFSCEGCPSAGHCHTAECHKKGEEV